jgi:membrane-associated phospholipid phosphatase
VTTLRARLASNLGLKLAGVAMYAAGSTGYVLVQQAGAGRARVVPWTPIDLLVPVMPLLAVVYVAQLAVLGVPTWLIADRRLLWLHLGGYAVIMAFSLTIFALLPTCVARPGGGVGLIAWVRSADGAGNALPSLHAACAVFAAFSLRRALAPPAWIMALAWSWVALVMVACVSLRQHTGYDLAAGAALAWIADRGVGRALHARVPS